mgnify:CR=1 FL=1|jgi:hypothetical protein
MICTLMMKIVVSIQLPTLTLFNSTLIILILKKGIKRQAVFTVSLPRHKEKIYVIEDLLLIDLLC